MPRCELPGGVTSCATGSCLLVGCVGSLGDCDGEADNGCEADLASLATCGTCDTACPTGVTQGSVACVGGGCRLTCNAGFGNCDARIDNGCEQSLSSPSACGMCGVGCSDPTPLCAAVSGGYACTEGCAAGTPCGESCVDTSTDPSHCGMCDRACPTAANAVASCASGTCGLTCASGFDDCDMDMGNGCETMTSTSVSSCGTCETACAEPGGATATCSGGACGYTCRPGFADCNGTAGDGCEVATATDAANCGSCGNACTLQGGATAVACTAGACTVTACEADRADCDGSYGNGCEVDTQTNRNHCGACGNACGPAQRCCGSECRRVSEC